LPLISEEGVGIFLATRGPTPDVDGTAFISCMIFAAVSFFWTGLFVEAVGPVIGTDAELCIGDFLVIEFYEGFL